MTNKEGFLKLSEAPFLKYLISFVTGVLLQMNFGGGYYIALPFILLSICLLYYHFTAKLSKTKFARRKYFGYAIFSMFIAFGAVASEFHSKPNITLPETNDYAIAEISESIEVKEKSVECKSTIVKFGAEKDDIKGLKTVLYIEKDSLSQSLALGDVIIFEENLQPIKFSNNPYSINYSSILEKQGFFYSQYIPHTEWKKIDHIEQNSIFQKSSELKAKLTNRVNSIDVSETTKSLINAMLLGDTSYITAQDREEFSSAGLSHILAVSGLHVGIIALIIYFILYPLKWMRLSRVRPLIAILILWSYIFVIGFPPSAVRATIMATFVLVGEVLNRKGTTINSLLAAALFMLLYNPAYISDVGFQLSFTAVFSIFYIYPIIYSYLPHKNRVTSYLSSIIGVTLAAQIGTLPLTVYYFHQISLIGLFSNFFIIPILPIVVVIAMLVMIFPISPFTFTTDLLFSYIDSIAQITSSIPYSSINDVYIKSYYPVVLYIIIFWGVWTLRSKRSELLILLLIFISGFLCIEKYFIPETPQCKAVIYDDNKITALNFIDSGYNYVLTIDTIGVESKVENFAKNLWIKEAIPNATFKQDSIFDKGLYVTLPYISYKGDKYLVLNNSNFKTKQLTSGARLYINKAIICEGFSGSITNLLNIFLFEEVVIASNLNHFKRNSIINECKKLKIPYYDIKECGAYMITEK